MVVTNDKNNDSEGFTGKDDCNEDETIKIAPSKINNATIGCYGRRISIWGYEVVDEKQGIWRGKVLLDLNAPKGMNNDTQIFFSRLYDKDNDQDRMLHEYEILDETIKGVKFLVIPGDKLLFLYEPSSLIIKAPMSIRRKLGKKN